MKKSAGIGAIIVGVFWILGGTGANADAQTSVPWSIALWSSGNESVMTTIEGPGTLQLTDFECAGDNFRIFDSATDLGAVVGGPITCAVDGNNIDAAFVDPAFASASFSLGPGSHDITIQHTDGFSTGRVAYRLLPPGSASAIVAATAYCVESDMIQQNTALQGLRAGDNFPMSRHHLGHISTGLPTCAYGCIDGFDLNCDGKIGDFCPVELDRLRVSNVPACLAATQPSAPAQTASVPAAVPIAIPARTLAHTGSHDLLSEIAVALLGLGAVSQGLSHWLGRRRRRSGPRRRAGARVLHCRLRGAEAGSAFRAAARSGRAADSGRCTSGGR